jgi:putative addiction module killer protein
MEAAPPGRQEPAMLKPPSVEVFELRSGRSPFLGWLYRLRDARLVDPIRARISALEAGQLGEHRALERGLFELRVAVGRGARIYFAQEPGCLLLLCAGSKETRQRDVALARQYLNDYRERSRGAEPQLG